MQLFWRDFSNTITSAAPAWRGIQDFGSEQDSFYSISDVLSIFGYGEGLGKASSTAHNISGGTENQSKRPRPASTVGNRAD